MIKKWRNQLAELGFELKSPSKNEVVYERDEGSFILAVFEDRMKGDAKKKRLNLFIFIKDRFSKQGKKARILVVHGFLGRSGVDTLNEGFGDWWITEEETLAFDALLAHGIPWFSQHCNINYLTDFWENYRHPNAKNQPPIRHLYLSLLYDLTGDKANACMNGRKWLDFRLKLPPEGEEPERTKRQIEIMGC